jgi:hypothetical protein
MLDGDHPMAFAVGSDQEDFASADPLVASKLASYASTVLAGSRIGIP